MPGRRFAVGVGFLFLASLVAASPGFADVASPRDVHLDVTLASGERLQGSGTDGPVVLTGARGRFEVALATVRSLDRNDDGETASLRTADGTKTRCVVEPGTLDVLPAGRVTPRRVAMEDVVALRVTPRLRIAGSGDAWWDLSFDNARGWEVDNALDRLAVRAIDPATVNAESHGPWSEVRLGRDVAPFGDFQLTASLAWDADGTGPRAMHSLYVTLLDADGREIASAGHYDPWVATTGERWSRVAYAARGSGYDTQPATGRCDLRIVRRGGEVRVLFDGVEQQRGESRAPLARIVVQVDFYPYAGPSGESTFGTATLERLEIR